MRTSRVIGAELQPKTRRQAVSLFFVWLGCGGTTAELSSPVPRPEQCLDRNRAYFEVLTRARSGTIFREYSRITRDQSAQSANGFPRSLTPFAQRNAK